MEPQLTHSRPSRSMSAQSARPQSQSVRRRQQHRQLIDNNRHQQQLQQHIVKRTRKKLSDHQLLINDAFGMVLAIRVSYMFYSNIQRSIMSVKTAEQIVSRASEHTCTN